MKTLAGPRGENGILSVDTEARVEAIRRRHPRRQASNRRAPPGLSFSSEAWVQIVVTFFICVKQVPRSKIEIPPLPCESKSGSFCEANFLATMLAHTLLTSLLCVKDSLKTEHSAERRERCADPCDAKVIGFAEFGVTPLWFSFKTHCTWYGDSLEKHGR